MRYLPWKVRMTYAYSNLATPPVRLQLPQNSVSLRRPLQTSAYRLGLTATSSRFLDYENRVNKAALHIASPLIASCRGRRQSPAGESALAP
jgi:hypothetical protein